MKKTISWMLTIILCLIMILPNYIYANNQIATGDFKEIYQNKGNTNLIKAGGNVLSVVQVVGISCGVIMLLILGVKYMMMSSNAESKATIKEKLIPYVLVY